MKYFENPDIAVQNFAVEDIVTASTSDDRDTGGMATPWN